MHLGFEPYVPGVLYFGFWVVVALSIFWRPVVGIYYLVPLIPAQTFRDTLGGFPLGQNVVALVLIAVAIGVWKRGDPLFPKSAWKVPLWVYCVFTFLSLCAGTIFLGPEKDFYSPVRFSDWRNYLTMLFLVFFVSATVKTTKQMKIVILLICLSTLLFDKNFWGTVSDRDYSTYTDDLRDAGAMGYAGANGLAAFEAQITVALLAFAAFAHKKLHWLGYMGLAVFSGTCLLYSLSRGGYVALAIGCLFLGIVKSRKLLVFMVVFGLSWTTLVPTAVVERVLMTDEGGGLDHSSETRVTLWEDAMHVFDSSPVTGTGFNTYAYTEHYNGYRDTHNIYVKFLVETGIVGLLLFLWLLYRTFITSFSLFRRARDPFHASLGLALAGWVVCTMAANFFGDRWTYLQVDGYMWILAGLVARAWMIEQETPEQSGSAETDPARVAAIEGFETPDSGAAEAPAIPAPSY